MVENENQEPEVMPFGHDWDGRLEEWLVLVEKFDPYGTSDCGDAPTWSFPTEALVKEYVASIETRREEQVRQLLRCFLFETVTFGSDRRTQETLKSLGGRSVMEPLMSTEYAKRLLRRPNMAHPGVRWILDLLPSKPELAISVIDAYLTASAQILPDGRLSGLWDASALISARYMSRKSNAGAEVLRSITPRELERLTARLYTKMGYQCELTQASRDGGRDVIAKLEQPGRREHRVIDCAHYAGTVPITKARALLGVASNEHATSAVLLTTGHISKSTRKEAAANSKLDLVDGERLIDLLDENFGRDWPQSINYWIQWPIRGAEN
ncbi:restriction system protein [Arthrobacter silviterrae]|uniref:Restriction endonuclease n=1 Tax=Arthrobacter silviterrae TaxID=2026658 RepID=A0ABX0DKQ1_9MICC|nr:restriction endonuclease [Arthrobacter silviterrae]MDQ0276566.1 restriction system protein [Arthrobacter silviterrae]NGN84812.1 restriction endonuclease [Arthrobacter silviterrae]